MATRPPSMFGGLFHDWLGGTWEEAKTYLRDELEQLRTTLNAKWAFVFGADNTLTEAAIGGAGASVPSYVANTGPKKSAKWEKVDLADGVKKRLKFVNLTAATVPSVLLGRRSTSAGDFEEITLGTNLSMSSTTLNASGGNSWVPIAVGSEPLAFVSDGAGQAVFCAFA